jgi:hypothetical protein
MNDMFLGVTLVDAIDFLGGGNEGSEDVRTLLLIPTIFSNEGKDGQDY